MPGMQDMDERTGDSHEARWLPPSNLSVREHAQIFHSGESGGNTAQQAIDYPRSKERPNWPFLFYEEQGVTYINKTSKQIKPMTFDDEALM